MSARLIPRGRTWRSEKRGTRCSSWRFRRISKERLRAVSKINRRSMVGEAVVAIERHVAAEEAVHPMADKGKGKKGGAK